MGEIRFDPESGTLSQGGKVVRFSAQAASIFEKLARRSGHVVPRPELAHVLDPKGSLADARQQLCKMLCVLRKGIATAGIPVPIVTYYGRGVSIPVPITIEPDETPRPLTIEATRLLKRLIERVRDREPTLAWQVQMAIFGE